MWYWKIATFECLTDAFIAAAMVWIASVGDESWAQMTNTAKTTVYIAATVSALKVVKAFLSTTKQDLKDEMPIDNGTSVKTTVKSTITESAPIDTVKPTTIPPTLGSH